MTEHPTDRAQFHAMTQGTQEDWAKIFVALQGFQQRACPSACWRI